MSTIIINRIIFAPCNFERYYIHNGSSLKFKKIFKKYIERIREYIPTLIIFGKQILSNDSLLSSEQLLFNIGICKEDYFKYFRELRLLYWKILLEDVLEETCYNDSNLTWYSLIGSNLFYPLESNDNYSNGQNYNTWFFENCNMYISLYSCIPYYFIYDNIVLIKNLAFIDMNTNSKRELLLHNIHFGLLSKYIKGNNLEDEITEYNFYHSDMNIQIKKLFEYKNGEIVLC